MARKEVVLSNYSLSLNKGTGATGQWTWKAPELPAKATIVSTKLSGDISWSGSGIFWTRDVTIGGQKFSENTSFNIDLGKVIQTSVSISTSGGSPWSSYTGTISNGKYIVEYTDPVPEPSVVKEIYCGDKQIQKIHMGATKIVEVYIGDFKIFG